MIEIKQHNNFDEIDESQWDALLDISSTNVPFLKYEYLKRWWEFKGGGEWPDGKLNILSVWKDGSLIGIAPFFTTEQHGQQKLMLLGSIEISDYLDFIYDPNYGVEFFNQLCDFLGMGDLAQIHTVLLNNLPENTTSHAFLQTECKKRNWSIQTEQTYHSPAIKLAQDWDAYLASIDKKQRHEIRRKLRRAEESPTAIKWHLVHQKDSLDQEIEDLFNLMVLDEAKKSFLTDEMRVQMRAIIHWAFDAGILHLSFLTIEGVKAAAYLCFDYLDRIWVYNSGFDPEFRDHSPGWVLLSYLIQHAIDNGKHTFDFMRGNEDYKYRFGAKDAFVLSIEITK